MSACRSQPTRSTAWPANSSCGKTTLIKTIAAAIRPPLRVMGGSVTFDFVGRHSRHARRDATPSWRRSAGRHLSYIMQGSMSVLNPVRRVRHAFIDFAFRHIGQPMPEFLAIVRGHLQRLHLAPDVLEAYPHELSGGMRQRVTIALATVCRPGLHHRRRADHGARCRGAEGRAGDDPRDPAARSAHRCCSSPTTWRCTPISAIGSASCMPAGWSRKATPPSLLRAPRHPYTAHLVASLPRLGDIDAKGQAVRRAAQSRRSAGRAAAFIRAVRWPWTSAAARCRRCRGDAHRVACFAAS